MPTSAPAPARALARDVADRLAAGIRALPGVADLHAGRYGEVAMLYPRHRVTGLRLTPASLEVHLVVDLSRPRPLAEVAAEVRTLARGAVTVPVDVFFADAREVAP